MIKLDDIFRYSPDGDGGETPQQTPDKTFTQKELDSIIANRLAEEKAKHNKKTEEMLKKLGVQDETKLDEIVVKIKDYESYKTKAEQLEAEKKKSTLMDGLRKMNIDDDFLDYALSKVDVDKFEESAQELIKNNPKILKSNFQPFNPQLPLNGKGEVDISKLSTEEYLAYRRKQQK